MSKNTTFRFAFGTKDRPGSSVWRVNIVRKTGDIYMHVSPKLGHEVHVSLHSSGRFHAKTAMKPYLLAGPWSDEYGLLWGPLIYFYEWQRQIGPAAPTGNTEKIEWLGWPDKDHFLIVKPTYAPRGLELSPHPDERRLFAPIQAAVNKEVMDFHLFVQHRPMTEDEKALTLKSPMNPITFRGGPLPVDMDLIRISPGGLDRPAQIIHERFYVRTEP